MYGEQEEARARWVIINFKVLPQHFPVETMVILIWIICNLTEIQIRYFTLQFWCTNLWTNVVHDKHGRM